MRHHLYGIFWVFCNMITNHIPVWFVRRFVYKLMGLKIGRNSKIALCVTIDSPWKIRIGDNTIINEKCYLDGRGGLSIGSNVSVSKGSSIITASHSIHSDTFEYYEGNVVVEDNVWIALGAIVLNGSYLTNGSVIGAGSVFKGKTDKNVIYSGNPAKGFKQREISNQFRQNLDLNFV